MSYGRASCKSQGCDDIRTENRISWSSHILFHYFHNTITVTFLLMSIILRLLNYWNYCFCCLLSTHVWSVGDISTPRLYCFYWNRHERFWSRRNYSSVCLVYIKHTSVQYVVEHILAVHLSHIATENCRRRILGDRILERNLKQTHFVIVCRFNSSSITLQKNLILVVSWLYLWCCQSHLIYFVFYTWKLFKHNPVS